MLKLVVITLALTSVGFFAPAEAEPGQNFGQCVRAGYQDPSDREGAWAEYGPFNLRRGDDRLTGGPLSHLKSDGASRFSLGHVCPIGG